MLWLLLGGALVVSVIGTIMGRKTADAIERRRENKKNSTSDTNEDTPEPKRKIDKRRHKTKNPAGDIEKKDDKKNEDEIDDDYNVDVDDKAETVVDYKNIEEAIKKFIDFITGGKNSKQISNLVKTKLEDEGRVPKYGYKEEYQKLVSSAIVRKRNNDIDAALSVCNDLLKEISTSNDQVEIQNIADRIPAFSTDEIFVEECADVIDCTTQKYDSFYELINEKFSTVLELMEKDDPERGAIVETYNYFIDEIQNPECSHEKFIELVNTAIPALENSISILKVKREDVAPELIEEPVVEPEIDDVIEDIVEPEIDDVIEDIVEPEIDDVIEDVVEPAEIVEPTKEQAIMMAREQIGKFVTELNNGNVGEINIDGLCEEQINKYYQLYDVDVSGIEKDLLAF